ncbi:sucrase/ferredoxin domain-containing protein [Xylariomycetidae sp. FL2044]|nr:sucrase/ferredoxin domain-containing protein [Xylariomycetidae sp. FL2044]
MMTAGLLLRIVYNSLYIVLCIILAALLLVVPGDFARQALSTTKQFINIIVIAIVYGLTILIVLFIYVLRLYVTRSVLASIPKTWVPIDKGDVPKVVHKLIVTSLGRSAAIAWEARPKVITPAVLDTLGVDSADEAGVNDPQAAEGRKSMQLFRSKPPPTAEDKMGIALPSLKPVWGHIEHPGWGSPASPDFPSLQYSTVVSELPNLVEAKAVSLAPPDVESTPDSPALDAEAVVLLQRTLNMTIRDYLVHLATLDVLPASQNISEFLDLYEEARFSTRPLSDDAFRHLMRLFADLLRVMQPLDITLLHGYERSNRSFTESEGHIDDDAPQDTLPTTPARSVRTMSSTSSRPRRPHLPARNSSANTWHQYRTAPTTPRSKAGGKAVTRSPSASSANTFAQTRNPYPISQASSSSLRSFSQGSVIRLATREDPGDMPFVLRAVDTI